MAVSGDNPPADMTYGQIDATLRTETAGGTGSVTYRLPAAAPEGYGWHDYRANGTWRPADNAVFNVDRDAVTVTLTDGGPADLDDAANGVIVYSGGLGKLEAGTGDAGEDDGEGGGGGGGGCFIRSAWGANG
jgi:hypothetical protein